jgi:hypothetical protein
MAVTFGTPTTATKDDGASTSITVTKPTGIVDDSHVIVVVSTRTASSNSTISAWTPPSGFTKITSNDTTTSSVHFAAFIKSVAVAATEPADYTFSLAWGGGQAGDMACYAVACIDADGAGLTATPAGTNSNTLTFDTLTPGATDTVYFACGCMNRTPTFTWNTGLTQLARVPSANATAGARITAFGATKTLSGASGVLTATASESRDHHEGGFLIAPFTPDPPVAAAGTDQTVDAGTYVTLDGSSSTGAASITYAWTQISGTPTAILDADDVDEVHFFAPVGATVLGFRLTVTDENGSDTDDVLITCNALPTGGVAPSYGLPLQVRQSGAWL